MWRLNLSLRMSTTTAFQRIIVIVVDFVIRRRMMANTVLIHHIPQQNFTTDSIADTDGFLLRNVASIFFEL